MMAKQQGNAFDLGNYVDVAERIKQLREKHPEASLQPMNPHKPYEIVTVGEQAFVVYTAACYRTPDDRRPGVGIAWEPFPGPTPYTRNSELQNAETSAWGRAIVAALAADTTRGIASANEVRNRRADSDMEPPEGRETSQGNVRRGPRVLDGWADYEAQQASHDAFVEKAKGAPEEVREAIKVWRTEQGFSWPMTATEMMYADAELTTLIGQADAVIAGLEAF